MLIILKERTLQLGHLIFMAVPKLDELGVNKTVSLVQTSLSMKMQRSQVIESPISNSRTMVTNRYDAGTRVWKF